MRVGKACASCDTRQSDSYPTRDNDDNVVDGDDDNAHLALYQLSIDATQHCSTDGSADGE